MQHACLTKSHYDLTQVVVDPLLWPHADYFTGPLIQIHLLPPTEGASSLLAAGARISSHLTLFATLKCCQEIARKSIFSVHVIENLAKAAVGRWQV